jgi:hypothetical protein
LFTPAALSIEMFGFGWPFGASSDSRNSVKSVPPAPRAASRVPSRPTELSAGYARRETGKEVSRGRPIAMLRRSGLVRCYVTVTCLSPK